MKTKSPFYGAPDENVAGVSIPGWADSWNPYSSPFFGDPADPGVTIAPKTGADILDTAAPEAAPAMVVNQVARQNGISAEQAIPSSSDYFRLVKVNLFYASNASITQSQVSQPINSSMVDMALSENLRNRPFPGLIKQTGGAGLGATTQLSVAVGDITPYAEVGIPWVYLTIAASSLNTKVGGIMTFTLTGKTASGVQVASTPWSLKREAVDKPVRVIMFPYVMMANRPLHQTIVVGTFGGVAQALNVAVTGLDTTESISIEVPGYSMGSLREIAMKFAFPSGLSF